MSQNKFDPLCEQKVVKKARLTHVTFNTLEPVLLVGDDRGGVVSLKLSPNLRKVAPVFPAEEGQPEGEVVSALDAEVDKLEKILDAARI